MQKWLIGVMAAAGVAVAAYGIFTKVKRSMSISVIGDADGPTSVYLAGRLGGDVSFILIAAGIVLFVLAVALYLKKNR